MATFNGKPIDTSGLKPVEPTPTPVPAPPITAGGPNPYIRTTVPLPFQYQPDTLRQFDHTGVSNFRTGVVPLNANPAVNAAAAGIAKTVVEQAITNISSSSSSAAGLVWQGTWSNTTTYAVNDVVLFNISAYVAIAASTGAEPDGNPSNWSLVGKNINLRGYSAGTSTASFVQVVDKRSFGATGGSVAFLSANTAGNFIVAFAEAAGNSVNPSAPDASFMISDTQGNTWTQVEGPTNGWYSGTEDSNSNAIWIAYNIKGGANTVSLGVTAGNPVFGSGLTLLEYSGSGNLNPFVFSAGAGSVADHEPPVLAINLTTNQYNQLVIVQNAAFPSGGVGRAANISEYTQAVGTVEYGQFFGFLVNGVVVSNTPQTVSSDTYYPSDVVIVSGVTYICVQKTVPNVTPITDINYWAILASGSGSPTFDEIESGTNTSATMTIGTGASLVSSGTGVIDATLINGIDMHAIGSLVTGQVAIVQPDGTVAYGDPFVQGVYPPGTRTDTGGTGSPPGPINPVLIGGSDYTGTPELRNVKVDANGNLYVVGMGSDSTATLHTTMTDTQGNQTTRPSASNTALWQQSSISFSTSGANTVIAGSAAKTIKVMRMFIVNNGAVGVTSTQINFQDTSSNIFTGAFTLTTAGIYTNKGDGEPYYTTASGAGFVINSSAAVQISGAIWFVQS